MTDNDSATPGNPPIAEGEAGAFPGSMVKPGASFDPTLVDPSDTDSDVGIADQASRGTTIGDQRLGVAMTKPVGAGDHAGAVSAGRGAGIALLAIAAGAAAFAYGLRGPGRRSVPQDDSEIDPIADRAATDITGASVLIAASPADLYRRWRRYEAFEALLPEVTHMTVRADDRVSDWTLHGPAGTRHQLVARIVEDQPDRRIAWEATGSFAAHKGSVSFEKQQRGTLVRLQMQLDPPFGRVGAAASRVLGKPIGKDPRQVARKALKRMKQLVETGEIARNHQHGNEKTGAAAWQ